MSNFAPNQEAVVEMVKYMSTLGLLRSWSSSRILDEVFTHVYGYLNVPSANCGSNLSKRLNNLLSSNRLLHSSMKFGSNSAKGGVVKQKLNANTKSNNVNKHQRSTIFFLSDNANNDEEKKKTPRKKGKVLTCQGNEKSIMLRS
uniref:Uncharacterized protein n=1 Tax=Solanum lycopersicum TaxID=4081 RepID=A0A3Q7G591_SOLLC